MFEAGVSLIGLFTPKFQTAFKPVVFESVVRPPNGPNLVCFPAFLSSLECDTDSGALKGYLGPS